VDEDFDSLGHSIGHTVTCNSLNLVDKKNQADASNAQSWSDISNGVKPIPNEWLTAAIQQATSDLINSQTEVKYAKTGILAIDKNDSNKIVILNSAGIGISTDGGKSFENAITAKGINASAINTGILKAIAIEGVTISSSTFETSGINGKVHIA
ncbi:phage tail protein, partial [Enterococcus faecalis]